MLRKKQSLKAAEEQLALHIQIEKAKARERTFAEEEYVQLEEPRRPVQKLLTPDAFRFRFDNTITPFGWSPSVKIFKTEKKDEKPPQQLSNHEIPRNRFERGDWNLQKWQFEDMVSSYQQLTAAITLPQPKIPIFKGNPLEYASFVMAFSSRIEPRAVSDADRLYYLDQHLEGEPKELVSGCLYLEPTEGYAEARRLLQEEYGDAFKIAMAYVNQVQAWPTIRQDDSNGLKKFSLYLKRCTNAMQSIDQLSVLNHQQNMQAVVLKLPFFLQSKWRERVGRMKPNVPTFKDLSVFVTSAAETANHPVFGREALRIDAKQTKYKSSSFAATMEPLNFTPPIIPHEVVKTPKTSCAYCEKLHDIDECEEFIKVSMKDRKDFIKNKGLCYACYGQGHVSKGCLKKRTCKICNKYGHPTSMHIEGFFVQRSGDGSAVKETPKLNSASVDIVDNAPLVLHTILPVKVKHKDCQDTILTYAFYDGGSGGCFMTDELYEQLGIIGLRTTIQLGTMHGRRIEETTALDGITVTDINGENSINLPRTFTRISIPVGHEQIPKPEVLKRWPHLYDIARQVPSYRPDLKIGLLIGCNCPTAFEPLEVHPSQRGSPFAVRLRHGWSISTPLSIHVDPSSNAITVNRVAVCEMENVKEIIVPETLIKMFEVDFNDNADADPSARGYSQEDRRFLEIVEEGTCRVDTHYVVPLPLRYLDVKLPNNRVQLIRDSTNVKQWRFVPSPHNPADDASRGIDVTTLIEEQQRWLNGPAFLREEEQRWPSQPLMIHDKVPSDDKELKCISSCPTEVKRNVQDTVSKLITYFSNWFCLKKAVAVFLSLKALLRKRCKDRQSQFTSKENVEPLRVENLKQAENAVIQFVQAEHFKDEIVSLTEEIKEEDTRSRASRRTGSVKRSSKVRGLDPYVDQHGILRVGGRLRRANIPEDAKHPIILPRKGHVTTIIIRQVHEELGHAGRAHVLAKLRERYWILGANSATRQLIHKCVTCRRIYFPPNEQKMADLPSFRLQPAPPFSYVGVDYFGPFLVKEGRKMLKRYGVIFTCLVTRAVHIELSSTLNTDSCIQAIRRLIARRGTVREIHSDNGTNFIGAEKELRLAIQQVNDKGMRERLLTQGIDWKFNPPSASHMGGTWERQIRSVRKILAGLLSEHGERINEESLYTLLCEVEAIINSRPLTLLSNEPDDLLPLSPKQLLTMKPNVIGCPPGDFQHNDLYLRKRWRQVQYLANMFWTRWRKEYLQTLQERHKWQKPKRNLTVGDVVLLKENTVPRKSWPMGVVLSVEADSQGFVRAVEVKTQATKLRRPVTKLVLLVPNDN